jgi:hypothetical protein
MTSPDPETKALQDAIFLSKVARARRTPLSEKIADGPLLFDRNIEIMRSGIRADHPEFSSEQVEKEVSRRLKVARMIDETGIYHDAGFIGDDD